MSKKSLSCVSSNSTPEETPTGEEEKFHEKPKEALSMLAKVGGKAPDFTAMAYQDGDFSEVRLSDYTDKWTILCFYPGDFTFV